MSPAAETQSRRALTVTLPCTRCQTPITHDLSKAELCCPQCGQQIGLHLSEKLQREGIVESCVVCQCPQVYERSDLHPRFGMMVAALACVISFILFALDQVILAFAVLVVATLFDWLLYRWLGKVVCCYRCEAEYRNYNRQGRYPGFDLALKERYAPLTTGTTEDPVQGWRQY
ncbi:MAG: hypothetical protein D6736_10945 [Nitrospinota bacterium]|nr:MAG: hypothetical protein D6736_10945 [Nitrospinota bacterium]